jgi:hypothetical protein
MQDKIDRVIAYEAPPVLPGEQLLLETRSLIRIESGKISRLPHRRDSFLLYCGAV